MLKMTLAFLICGPGLCSGQPLQNDGPAFPQDGPPIIQDYPGGPQTYATPRECVAFAVNKEEHFGGHPAYGYGEFPALALQACGTCPHSRCRVACGQREWLGRAVFIPQGKRRAAQEYVGDWRLTALDAEAYALYLCQQATYGIPGSCRPLHCETRLEPQLQEVCPK